MAYILLPISLFIKSFSISTTMFYVVQLPVYLYAFLILLIYVIRFRAGKKPMIWALFDRKILICSSIVLGLQIIALALSDLALRGNEFNRHPDAEFAKLVLLLVCISIHYFIVKLSITDEQSMMKFFRGTGIALLLLLAICYVQFLYLIFPRFLSRVVSFLGNLEYRYKRNWYVAGSYVQTERRINGLNPESDYLAVQFLVAFVPFILASLKNKINLFSNNIKYHASYYYTLLLGIIIILFFAKTTTGILAIGIILFALWLMIPHRKKIVSAIVILAALALIYIVAIYNPMLKGILDTTLLNKLGGDSMLDRTGGTVGLILTWLTHPIFGVGFNYHDYYLFKYVPKWTMTSYEFRSVFGPEKSYPILSAFFGWFAEFGTVFVVFISVYVIRLLKDFRAIATIAEVAISNVYEKKMILALKDAAFYFFSFYFVCALLIFNWYESIYLIVIFFFVVVRQQLKSRFLKKEFYR